MTNKKNIKRIAVFMAILLLFAGVISALAIAIGNKNAVAKPKDEITESSGHDFNSENGTVVLALGAPKYNAATQSNDASVSYDVTATITPSDVENKEVDWKIEWSDDAALKDMPIADYLTLTPTSDGSLTAKLTCIKAFRGSVAILSATSRDSGVRGTCSVTFSGKPETMKIDVSGIGTQSRGNISGVLQVKRGQIYTQSISLGNIFNDVGTEYSDFSVTVTGIGSFKKGTFTSTIAYQNWEDIVDVTLESVKNNYISAKIENGKLVIEAKDRYENMRGTSTGNSSGGTTRDLYKEDNTDESGNLPYYQIKVTENKSGLYETLNVYVVSTVNTVSINYGNIDF